MRWAAKDPFGLTADPRMYVARPATEEALDELRSLLEEGESTVRLAGPAGFGKTMLLRLLPERLGPKWLAAYLGYPKLSPDELWTWVAEELGYGHPSEDGIRAVAARAALRGGGLVLLVDDAHAMPEETRRVLAGICAREPGLRVLLTETCDIHELGHPAEVRLAEPLSMDELKEYLEQRIQRAGVGGLEAALFDEVDPGRFYALSEGVPARVHYLAARLQCGDRLPGPGAPSAPATQGAQKGLGTRAPTLAPVEPEAEPSVLRIVAPPPTVEAAPDAEPRLDAPTSVDDGDSEEAETGSQAQAVHPADTEAPSPTQAEREGIAAIATSLDVEELRAAETVETRRPSRVPGGAPLAAVLGGLVLLIAGLVALVTTVGEPPPAVGGVTSPPVPATTAPEPRAPAGPSPVAVVPQGLGSALPAPPPSSRAATDLPPPETAAPSEVPAVSAPPPTEPGQVPLESGDGASSAEGALPVPDVVYRTAATPGPAAAPAVLMGYLSVNAVPWAQIAIDGRDFGETPLGELELPVGEHEVTVRFPDGSEVARRVKIGDEEIFLVVRQEDS